MSTSLFDLLQTQAFWVATTTGSIVLGVAANLVTPAVSKFFSRFIEAKQLSTKEKRIAYRRKVIRYQDNLEDIVSGKLNVVFDLLNSIVLFMIVVVGANFVDLIHFSEIDPFLPSLGTRPPKWLILLLFAFRTGLLVIGILISYRRASSSFDDMRILWKAEMRDMKGRIFLRDNPSSKSGDLQKCYDEWDRKMFGVSSVEDDGIHGLILPKGYVLTSEAAPAGPESRSSSP